MFNMNQIMNLFRVAQNPQAAIMQMFQQNAGNNPMAQNIMGLANAQDAKGLEGLARNLCKSKGVNIDELINQAKQMMK